LKNPSNEEEDLVVSRDTSLLPVLRQLRSIHKLSGRVIEQLDKWPQEVSGPKPNELHVNVEVTRARIAATLSDCDDVRYQSIQIQGASRELNLYIIFVEGLAKQEMIQEHMIKPLRAMSPGQASEYSTSVVELVNNKLTIAGANRVHTVEDIVDAVLTGNTAIIVDGAPEALVYDTQGWKDRQIENPMTEVSIVGPHDAFNENLQDNIALIRRRLRDPDLKVRIVEVGSSSRTQVAIFYIEDRARAEVVAELLERIENIKAENILNTNYIEELITGKRFMLYPLMRRTARPDVAASYLIEGRVIVLADVSPQAMAAPATIGDFFMAADDYYLPPVVSLLLRVVRLVGGFIVLFIPAFYISVAAYNPDVLPLDFLQRIAQSRAAIPLTVLLEVIFMETMMELLQEAGVRLPQKIGAIATVFGGLILGQAAAAAGIISNIMVIIIAMTAIGSFVIPSYEMSLALRVTRWVIVTAATFFGMYGLGIITFLVIVYLNSLNSFGTPYLAPFAPLVGSDVKHDSLLRAPQWLNEASFKSIHPQQQSNGKRNAQ
jgi:spore germination protein